MRSLLTVLGMAAALVACAGDATSFARYQTIIDRKPFGPEPVNFDPEATPGSASARGAQAEGEMTPEQRTAEEQQLASSVRVAMLNVRPSGDVAVGFTDTGANPPANYYLTVGRSQDGWTVKSADPATESVTLAKEGIEVTVKLGENAGGKGGKGNGVSTPRRMMPRPLQMGAAEGRGPSMASPSMAPVGNGPMGGLARLRLQRQEREAREAEEARRRREADDAAKAERQEREAREAEEKQRAAEERAQQREALLQIQEQLKRAREEREAAKREQQEGGQNETNDPE